MYCLFLILMKNVPFCLVNDSGYVQSIYCRSGFDCENLLIANYKFSLGSQSIDSHSDLERTLLYSMGLTIAIIVRLAIWPD